jgi:hypothetical protein
MDDFGNSIVARQNAGELDFISGLVGAYRYLTDGLEYQFRDVTLRAMGVI